MIISNARIHTLVQKGRFGGVSKKSQPDPLSILRGARKRRAGLAVEIKRSEFVAE
jgi:hypothetical protein